MAELLSQERLQPSLLDRLTGRKSRRTAGVSRAPRSLDDEASRGGAPRPELAIEHGTQLRPPWGNASSYPLVAKSVLNFGAPDSDRYHGFQPGRGRNRGA
jgi:hypothetical protein